MFLYAEGLQMGHVSYTELRQNLARYMDQAVDDRVPIVVTRQAGKGNVVILSEEEFEGWRETVHLLSNPANAARLLRSIRSADAGRTQEHDLIEPQAKA
jgi:antitoxin YefM